MGAKSGGNGGERWQREGADVQDTVASPTTWGAESKSTRGVDEEEEGGSEAESGWRREVPEGLHEEMVRLVAAMDSLSAMDAVDVDRVERTVRAVVERYWEGCRVSLFGSRAVNLALPGALP